MSITTEPAAATVGRPAASVDAPRGLSGVVVAQTSIGDVLGTEGRYHYRGHDAIELAREGDFERAWHLLVLGTPPDEDAAARFRARVAALRTPPSAVREFVERTAGARLAGDSSDSANTVGCADDNGDGGASDTRNNADARHLTPLRGLQATLPVLAEALGGEPLYDLGDDDRVEQALAVGAAVPGILAAFHRAGQGLDPWPDSSDDRGAVADYLARVTGRVPDERSIRALSAYLIATLDHGLNASTFTARVIASTGADLASCIAGALGALSGPLHGGAPSRALDALDAVATPADIEPYLRGELSAGRRLMGFGHAVYRTADPRSRLLRQVALEFGGPRVELAVQYEQTAERLLAEYKPGRDLHTNVEFYAAVVLEQCGIPRDMFTPTFAMSRVVGWSAHVLEQARDPKIIRPSSRYVP
ncbi:citrate/2-methylcitrate synthase [Humibacter ginsenosidimutans]|uniref:citrate synthase (unknown stereospecificity) n=1 Tax=Humibacter ginsenosidimutans TaxID=2599293 RepID=A0A5B8M377_9MICO|nr:citrate/2-methylcitrate synthase [Humibacter ginsenosidimutans]QDZ15258.1 citrate synthase/methylcitrate synthase [Humibacter ginsenosidimutans]